MGINIFEDLDFGDLYECISTNDMQHKTYVYIRIYIYISAGFSLALSLCMYVYNK